MWDKKKERMLVEKQSTIARKEGGRTRKRKRGRTHIENRKLSINSWLYAGAGDKKNKQQKENGAIVS